MSGNTPENAGPATGALNEKKTAHDARKHKSSAVDGSEKAVGLSEPSEAKNPDLATLRVGNDSVTDSQNEEDVNEEHQSTGKPHAVLHHSELVEPLDSIAADEDLLDDIPSDTDELDLTHLKIGSLKPLKLNRFPRVKSACFRQNLLASMSGVEGLPSDIENLDFYDNRLDRIDRHIEHFNGPALSVLDLSFNNIRHIRHLQDFVGLRELFLCQNDIGRIEHLETLTELENLELGANRIREIKALDTLTNLQTLWLAKNKLTRLDNLDPLVNLRLLSVQSNRLTHIEGLDKLVNLEELYISHNMLERIEGLEHCPKLSTIDVSNNKIKELSGLAHLEDLEELWASSNAIERLDSVERELKHLPRFHTIYLEGNPVQEASGPMYRKKVQLALGPSLRQIDATPIVQ